MINTFLLSIYSKKTMLKLNEEYFGSNYYFLLREKKDGGHLWFSVANTITEARKKDEYVKVPKDKIEKLKQHLEKIIKSKKKKSTEDVKSEVEEIVNSDGTLSNSNVPILDPAVTPRKTMDQTIQSTRQPGNYLAWSYRGGRTYYSESEVKEEDMSAAFGYEETKDLPPEETIKTLEDMGVDNPVERAIEFGKDPNISQEKKKKGSDMKIRLQEKESLKKLQKEQMAKIIEDILLGNKKKKDFVKKNNKPEVLSKGEIMDLIKSKSGIENKSKVIKSSSEQ
jgi:hypothetical protein